MSKSMQICKQCGSGFEVDTSRRNWQHFKLCSDKCRKAVAADQKRSKYKPKVLAKSQCQHCGEMFQPVQTIGARQKYCTRECYLKTKTAKAHAKWADSVRMKVCVHCGNDFLPRKFGGGVQIYCSHTCQVRAVHKRHDGKSRRSNEYEKEFRVMKPAVLERDKVCVLCGSDDRLHVHHWDNSGRSENYNNSLDNLSVLCQTCHRAMHNVTLAKINGEWCLMGRIFEIIKIDGPIPIKS